MVDEIVPGLVAAVHCVIGAAHDHPIPGLDARLLLPPEPHVRPAHLVVEVPVLST